MPLLMEDMFDFLLYEKGEDIKLNGILDKALILDAVDKINQDDDKIIHHKFEIKTGDIVEYIGQKYLITSQIDNNTSSFCGRIKQCNHKIAFNFDGNVKWFDAIIESKVMDITTNQYMSLASGQIKVTLQDNVDSRDISVGKRFINTARAFETSGIDKSRKGLITLTCDLSQTDSNDDLANDIADRWEWETIHAYVLTISNGTTMEAPLDGLAQVNVTVTDNGTIMTTLPPLTFLTSDSNVVSVDNDGRMIGISTGIAIITVKMTYKESVFDKVTVTVVENVNHVLTMGITGATTVKASRTGSYVAHFYDNGVEIFDKAAIFTIRNQDGTGTLYANITATTGNAITITAGSSYNKYVVLKATLSEDSTMFAEFTVKVVSLI